MVITNRKYAGYYSTKDISFNSGLFPKRGTEPIPDIPAFVTAFSSNHFEEGRAMLYNFNETLRRRYPKLKLYFFDIGLKKEEAFEASIFRYIFFIYTILFLKDNTLLR